MSPFSKGLKISKGRSALEQINRLSRQNPEIVALTSIVKKEMDGLEEKLANKDNFAELFSDENISDFLGLGGIK